MKLNKPKKRFIKLSIIIGASILFVAILLSVIAYVGASTYLFCVGALECLGEVIKIYKPIDQDAWRGPVPGGCDTAREGIPTC